MKKIYLSPANQDYNVGVGDYGTESERMLQIAESTKRKLEYNFEVKIGSKEESLEKRVNQANTWQADAYVAIHSNAGGGRGCEVFAYSKESKGKELAECIYKRMERITPSSDRGVKYNESFYELKNTIAPACLIEVAFHDNIDDANWIINNTELIGIEIANGIYEFFGIEDKEEKIKYIQKTLNERYNFKISEDGIYGIETKKALVMALQIELNKQYSKGIKEDGIFGPETKKACINVEYGAVGNITWIIQAMLVCKGYDIEVDGIYGDKTREAINDFQRKSGLKEDGICGKDTFKKLFR